MKISEFPNAFYVGDIVHHHNEYKGKKYVCYKRKLSLKTLPEHKKIVKEKLAICYFMVVNGEIMKIGQSSGEDGLHSCMGFYGVAMESAIKPNEKNVLTKINKLPREQISPSPRSR